MERLKSNSPNSRELLKTNLRLKMEKSGLIEGMDWDFINPHVYTALCIFLKDVKNSKIVPPQIDQIPVHINPTYTKMN